MIGIEFEYDGKRLRVYDDGSGFNAYDLCNIIGFRNWSTSVCRYVSEANIASPSGSLDKDSYVNESGAWELITARCVRTETIVKVSRWFRKVLSEIDMPERAIQVFSHEQFGDLSTVEIDGEPWFLGYEIAQKLEYQNGSRDVNRHVDEEDRRTESIVYGGQRRNMTLINESGLYALILSSKLPNAKKFKRWVTSEVLPAIRKNGQYQVNSQATAIQLIMQRFDKLETKLLEDKPKVEFYDAMQASEGSVRMDCLANILAKKGITIKGKPIGRNNLYERLRSEGWLSKNRIVDGYGKKVYENRPTQKAIEKGLFERVASHNHGILSYTVYVKAKGIEFFVGNMA